MQRHILLSNEALVDASGEGGGDIQIQGARLEMTQGSNIWANTLRAGNGGQLTVIAIDRIEVSDSSNIRARVNSNATGNGGDVIIQTQDLRIIDGANLSASTFGEGDAGNLSVNATDRIEVSDSSSIAAQVSSNATGDGGNLTLVTGELLVSQRGFIAVSTFGTGDGGELKVDATKIELIGDPIDGNPTGLFATVNDNATGNGGNINITAGSASVTGGAQILARNNGGQGNAGRVTINATDTVTIAGFEGNGDATVDSDVTGGGTGNGNDVNITARSVFITDEAIVAASIIFGGENGNPAQAGDVNITASDTVSVSNSRVFSEIGSRSVGNGGTINIDAPNVVLENGASLITQIRQGGEGSGGDIDITTGSLSVTGGSQLFASTSGQGDAGNITIEASDSVSFDGVGSNRFGRNVFTRIPVKDSSGAYSTVEGRAVGNGGDIHITAPSITLSGNGQLSVETKGDGVAGNLTIDTGRLTVRDSLLANSCIVRRNELMRGSFFITGTGGLPERPGDAQMSTFPTVDIETLPSDGTPTNTNPNRPWQKGDPIIKPQGVYRLPNGNLVLSRECPQ